MSWRWQQEDEVLGLVVPEGRARSAVNEAWSIDRSVVPSEGDGSVPGVLQPATDVGFAQRVKALACTAPLHDLDSRKSQVQSADFNVYQMSELALNAIDLVTLSMDFDTGAPPEKIVAGLAVFAARHAPDRDDAEHLRVARWVLENLLNVGSTDRGFRAVYGITAGDGSYNRFEFDFKLLEEVPAADGSIFLRATNEAVNVLVGALELDIESAQIAADLRLETLIRRGRLSDAQAAAQSARYRTIQYGEKLRQRLEATERDVRTVDWLTEMPAFIAEAVEHIAARFKAENAILVNIIEVRDTADVASRKLQAAGLVEVVRDCLRRHEQLQSALQAAGRRFRAQQDRQTFAPDSPAAALDLHAQLLVPVLGLPVEQADQVLTAYFARGTGVNVPSAVRLSDLFTALVTPPPERELLGGIIDKPQIDETEDEPAFPAECYDLLDGLLDLDVDAPRRLSGLLEEARSLHPDLPSLVIVRVVALAAQEINPALRHKLPSVFIAVDDGSVLDDPEFAGADLIVARAAIEPADAPGAAFATSSRKDLLHDHTIAGDRGRGPARRVRSAAEAGPGPR
ncbi:hypothetical protein NLX85_18060 [Micromonospora sp. A3M-1-15]|uniref:hypothetical protein n=1 Tax=Micromonospora sp. A3M-1-15 TaxID=2962035 RepID=UPI0020B76AFC|nr:hypothetical protein [Micromonospora sp. A3M-1-15]MCP3785273.1 hypothetical protein [Micromonospora sp. A3M-1-15]